MRYVLLLASVMMLAAAAGMAQAADTDRESGGDQPVITTDAGGDTSSAEESESNKAAATKEDDFRMYSEPVEQHAGDTVILKDGRRIENVQVLRRTPTDYEIEIVKGAAPMALPRTVVSDIEWDDYDPLGLNIQDTSSGEPAAPPSTAESTLPEGMTRDADGNIEVLPGVKVPAQLVGKLRKDITQQVPGLSGKSLFEVLKALSLATHVQIVADTPLRQMAKTEDLKVDVTVKDGATVNLVQFFHDYLLKQPEMRRLDIVYKPDRMLVTTKEAAEKMRKEQKDASGEAAGESPRQGQQ
ncbi:MAG TPA: hypothetical protein PLM14_14485 [Candidatus Hydrogenedentes bacterium]|mgnify:CR=1 FL=1|nr:hypothetical protein [Candidatus Hydrogenedentota bacterium]HQE84206.1 hypothetical protein [Candidatus Hydrogenedentota bacterium]HQH53891.1 hypothetical protein [Candidatus Hydrogenedentota bacterium]HQM48962.1 hypothetical protein [Candidatus Hydrogenedentota bacterium]